MGFMGDLKSSTEEMLVEELRKHRYTGDYRDKYNFDRLFDKYCTSEIDSYADLLKNHARYVNFVLSNYDLIDESMLEGKTRADKISCLRSILWDRIRGFSVVSPICYKKYKAEQDAYVSLVNYITDKKDRLLDVGAGRVPLSSILMAESREDGVVSSMDWITLPDDVMRKFKVKRLFQNFRHDTSVDKYDIVVAHRACDAFPAIVSNCARSNKAYFMKLCDCAAPTGEIEGWRPYLSQFDSEIKFDSTGYFVTNLDISRDQFDRALAMNNCKGN